VYSNTEDLPDNSSHLCCDVRFVEYGEYNGNLYGTTFDQVTSIVNAALVCVLCSNTKVRIQESRKDILNSAL